MRNALILTVALLSSCGLMATETQPVSVTTDRSDVLVEIDGIPRGNAPVVVQLSRRRSHSVILRSGVDVRMQTIGRKATAVMFMDILGTLLFIVPIIGIVGPGWFDLDTSNVYLPFDGSAYYDPSPDGIKIPEPKKKGPPKDPFDRRK